MSLRQPRFTRTDTLFPYTTLSRSHRASASRPGRAPPPPFARRRARSPPRYRDERRHGRSGRREAARGNRSEEHTSELQTLMRISYAVFGLKKQKDKNI